MYSEKIIVGQGTQFPLNGLLTLPDEIRALFVRPFALASGNLVELLVAEGYALLLSERQHLLRSLACPGLVLQLLAQLIVLHGDSNRPS